MALRPGNLLVAPRGRLLANSAPDSAALLDVSGLACEGLCVRRVQAALAQHLGVSSVQHTASRGRFRLELRGAISEDELDAAVQRAVVLRPVRLLIERLVRALTIKSDRGRNFESG